MVIIAAKLIALYILITGIIFLLSPKALGRYIGFWGKAKRLYFVGASRLLGGALLLFVAWQCRIPTIVFLLGILIFVLGIPYFVPGIKRMKMMLERWQMRPALFVRVLGLFMLVIGALLFYSV